MNKKLLKKQFQWQRDSSNYIIILSILIAWGLGASKAGIDPKIVFSVFASLLIFLGFFTIIAKWSEMQYEIELFDKRKKNKGEIIQKILFFIPHVWLGLILTVLGIYLLVIYHLNA